MNPKTPIVTDIPQWNCVSNNTKVNAKFRMQRTHNQFGQQTSNLRAQYQQTKIKLKPKKNLFELSQSVHLTHRTSVKHTKHVFGLIFSFFHVFVCCAKRNTTDKTVIRNALQSFSVSGPCIHTIGTQYIISNPSEFCFCF